MTAIDFAGPLPSSTVATVSQARGWARGLATNGPYADGVGLYSGAFACTDGGSLNVTVAAGEAIVDGVYALSTGAKTVTLAAADPGDDRIDLIVLRLTPTGSGSVTLAAVTGTPAGSPSAPAATQSASGVWEVPLAEVTVPAGSAVLGTITDVRTFVTRGNSFLSLADTPDSMAGKAGLVLRVNAGETSLEFGPAVAQTANDFADSATPINSTSQVTVDTLVIPQGAPEAGDLYVAEFVGYILNNSGLTIEYKPQILLNGVAVIAAAANSQVQCGPHATSQATFHCRVLVAFVGAASQRLDAEVGASDTSYGAGSFNPARTGTEGPVRGQGVATADSAAGALTIALQLASSAATATQTYTARLATLRRIAAP